MILERVSGGAGGTWNGASIVSPEWVTNSTSFDPERDQPSHYRDDFGQWIHQDGRGRYGHFWYGRARDGTEPDYFAEGDHGQFVYASPSADTVVVRLGTEFGLPSSQWVDAFYRFCGT
jgi:CubicO group peptidase (beta-lactamase class C family)